MGSITINGKKVKSITIGGKNVKSLMIGGKVLSLVQTTSNWHFGGDNPHPTKNDWKGSFSTPAKQAEFEAITTSISTRQFINEPNLTGISLPNVTSIGAAGIYFSPLTYINIPKATTIGFHSLYASVNNSNTEIYMHHKFNSDAEKDKIFRSGNWSNMTFHWLGDDGAPWVSQNSFVGTWSSSAKENQFLSLTNELPGDTWGNFQKFGDEPHITGITMLNATSVGRDAMFNSPLTLINLPKVTSIEMHAFNSVVNAASTVVTMNAKFNTVAEKDRVFGAGHWHLITFHWTNNDGTPWVDPNPWHYGDGNGGPHPTKNDWKGSFQDLTIQRKYEAIGGSLEWGTIMKYERNLIAVSLPRILHILSEEFLNPPLKELYLPNVQSIGRKAFYNSPLTYIYAPKAYSVGQFAFASTVNSQSTTVVLYHSINIDSEKNKIFDYGQWNKINFQWV